MSHRFYANDTLLFCLGDSQEYDTATPYRYAVSRFVEVASLLRQGTSVTISSQTDREQVVTLETVEQLWDWLSVHFNGFGQYVLGFATDR